jgi:hypothetical protein
LLDRIPASLAACCLDAGHRRVKNLRDPVRVYRVLAGPLTPAIALRAWLAASVVHVWRWIAVGSSAAALVLAAVTLSAPATARQEPAQASGQDTLRPASVTPAVHAVLHGARRDGPVS